MKQPKQKDASYSQSEVQALMQQQANTSYINGSNAAMQAEYNKRQSIYNSLNRGY